MGIKLSIITIVLNDYDNIEKTVLSVLSQKNNNIQYIIIDGGSTDGTVDVINKYINYIDYFVSESDNGIYDAINKGLRQALGNYVGILNSGDFYCDKILTTVLNISNFNYDIIYGNIYFNNINNLKIANLNYLNLKMSIFHPSTFVNNSIYKKYGYYDTSYKISADYDFILKCFLKNASFYYLNIPFVIFNLNGVSSKNYKLGLYENYLIKKKYFNFFVISKFYIISLFKYYLLITINKLLLFSFGKYNTKKFKKICGY